MLKIDKKRNGWRTIFKRNFLAHSSKINSSLTNKTIQLLNTQTKQKNNTTNNKINNLILYKQIQQCRMSINNLEMGLLYTDVPITNI